MSLLTQPAAGHVTSTTTSGKYLNPETIDLSEIYSKRTPLDLLIETCNNIGKDASAQQTSAKQRRPKTSPRDQSDHWNQSPSTKQQGTRLRDVVESGNAVVSDWCPSFRDSKGTRSGGDKEAIRRFQSTGGDTFDQDGPEDLRLWSNRQSPDGSSMLDSPVDSRGRKSPSRDSLSSLSPSSHPSPTATNGSPYPRFSHDTEEVKHHIRHNPLAESLRERDAIPSNLPHGIDAGFMLHQYLELQSMIQLAMLQERANQVRCLTLDKPLTAFTSPGLTELSPESRTIYGLSSDISACHQLLSKIQQEEILQGLSSGVAIDGLLPLGFPYLAEASPFRGRLPPLPSFYHQHLATKAAGLLTDSFLPGLFKLRPEEMVFGSSNFLLFAKHIELLNHISDSPLSRPLQPYDASPITGVDTPDRYVESSERCSPMKPRLMHSPSRRQSPRSPVERPAHRRHHPYGRPESPSARSPVSAKSSPSFSRHSAFREPVLLSDTM